MTPTRTDGIPLAMKSSIYVPDDLWGFVSEEFPGDNPSQLVQRALRALMEATTESGPAYSERPPGAEQRLAIVQDRLIREAREEYQRGYNGGVDIAQRLNHRALERLARKKFNVLRWLDDYANHVRGLAVDSIPATTPDDPRITHAIHVLMGAEPPGPGEQLKPEFPWLAQAAALIGQAANAPGREEWSFYSSGPRVRGFSDALRDLWRSVESDGREI